MWRAINLIGPIGSFLVQKAVSNPQISQEMVEILAADIANPQKLLNFAIAYFEYKDLFIQWHPQTPEGVEGDSSNDRIYHLCHWDISNPRLGNFDP